MYCAQPSGEEGHGKRSSNLSKQGQCPHPTHPPFPWAALVHLPQPTSASTLASNSNLSLYSGLYITSQNATPGTDQGGIDMVHAPPKMLKKHSSNASNFVILVTFGTPPSQTPLTRFVCKKNLPSFGAGFRNLSKRGQKLKCRNARRFAASSLDYPLSSQGYDMEMRGQV